MNAAAGGDQAGGQAGAGQAPVVAPGPVVPFPPPNPLAVVPNIQGNPPTDHDFAEAVLYKDRVMVGVFASQSVL